ncbi:hypothetical protein FA15DRAFT_697904 [Coprinopsis marcescibilis]|uniref:Uncharacterized protein n=1 Tax=Coprinopsis marcescibilis TaxID=230819 RepID=A0A5C3KF90_COPMA|nr:hypothetical protein FA15DRAFT_697904 [Coprinopsis marcescibilis]
MAARGLQVTRTLTIEAIVRTVAAFGFFAYLYSTLRWLPLIIRPISTHLHARHWILEPMNRESNFPLIRLDDDTDSGNAHWKNLRPAEHCLRYATRDYIAFLTGIPYDASAVGTCRETSVGIHGQQLFPNFCQDLGSWGGIWGHWTIGFKEPDCVTRWMALEDQGCTTERSGLKDQRLRATLGNLRINDLDNWEIMCATTPLDVEGIHLPTPSSCTREADEVEGHWDVSDEKCN